MKACYIAHQYVGIAKPQHAVKPPKLHLRRRVRYRIDVVYGLMLFVRPRLINEQKPELSFEIIEYRNERLAYWAEEIGNGLYTDQVFINAENDVKRKFNL